MTVTAREYVRARYHTDDALRFGIEVEVEGIGQLPDLETWRIEPDGSLRDGGFEFISSPAKREEIDVQLDALYTALADTTARASLRTSTHVHVNMQPRTMAEIELIIGFSILAEPLLMSFAGDTREENIYCVPFYRTPGEVDTIAEAIQSNLFERFGNTCKYSGLYLAPLLRFGTIEYRHAPYWPDRDSLGRWLDLIEVCATAHERFNTLESMIAQCEQDPWNFFRAAFGAQLEELCPNRALLEELMDTTNIITIAERLQPCTYKAEFAPTGIIFGAGDRANELRRYYTRAQAPSIDPPDFDPYYDEEPPEEYDEETW
jgi:hypothetical protein